ncbi:hypothetical protein MUP46_04275 [Patescibacteria group bacterium]|nr:hypothetical protein [Patescibacteria group bacterium]
MKAQDKPIGKTAEAVKGSKEDIKPQGRVVLEGEERLKYFSQICIRGANQIRKYLNTGESGYRYLSGKAHQNVRDYYLYAILDEIEKAGLALMNCADFILGGEGDPVAKTEGNERITRNIYSTSIDQLSLWSRKLTEILVEAISFKTISNDELYFRHYLLVTELKRKKKLYQDFWTYHACKSGNIEFQISELEDDINTLRPSLDPAKVWYARHRRDGTIGTSLTSFEDRLKNILPRLSPDQKLAIGDSYQPFSTISSNLHPSFGDVDYDINMHSVDTHYMHIGILAANILVVVKSILAKKPRGFVGQLSRIFKENKYPRDLYRRKSSPSIKIGDFVIAYSELAEVVVVRTSKFGQKSFRVRFLEKSPLPNMPEDEFPAQYVQLYKKRSPLTRQVREMIKKDAPDLKVNNREVVKAVRVSILHMWSEVGFKEFAFGQREQGIKKMGDYLSKNKAMRKAKAK